MVEGGSCVKESMNVLSNNRTYDDRQAGFDLVLQALSLENVHVVLAKLSAYPAEFSLHFSHIMPPQYTTSPTTKQNKKKTRAEFSDTCG